MGGGGRGEKLNSTMEGAVLWDSAVLPVICNDAALPTCITLVEDDEEEKEEWAGATEDDWAGPKEEGRADSD